MRSRHTLVATAVLAVLPYLAQAAPAACVQATQGQVWMGQAFSAQRAGFTVSFDASVSSKTANGLIGLASGQQSQDNLLAAVVRFNADGQIDARNGAIFSALKAVSYHADAIYRIRMDVNVVAHTYSVWVQRKGGRKERPFRQIAQDFAFSPQQAAAMQLDTLVVHVTPGTTSRKHTDDPADNQVQVCNLAVEAVAPAPPNADCTLIVPDNPLSATGLATPYRLVATDPARGACRQTNPAQSAFVQASIIDPATGQVSVYAPLVVDEGSTPAAPPVLPTLPANAVVGIWFGFNGDNLTLAGAGKNALAQGRCVNGVERSVFGQFAHCNAPSYFDAANAAIKSRKLTVPPLGTAVDGQPCPSSRSFWVVDQDQSDNVPTVYLNVNGQTAQATRANRARFPQATTLGNPSDERLVAVVLDPVLRCTPFTAADLADPGQQATALPLNELQAAAYQAKPALVPPNDPMVLVDGERSLAKLNAYRAGVNQPPAREADDEAAKRYCRNLRETAPAQLVYDRPWLGAAASPSPTTANSLFTFMASRYVTSYAILECKQLTGRKVNMTLVTDSAGVVVDASVTH